MATSGSPVLEYETVGTLGNILIKGAASKSIQVVDSITFTGLSTGGDQYSATGLFMTGSITASLGFSGSINGIGNVSAFSASIDSRIVNNQPIGYVTTSSFEAYTSSTNSRVNAIESFTSSIDTTIKTKLNLDNVISGSTQITTLLPAGVVSGSSQVLITDLDGFADYNDAKIFDINQKLFSSSFNEYTQSTNTRLNSLEIKTGSYATTGSNTFFGTQTFSGSVYIANDLIVQGSSSIQYISASSVSIGTNIVQLNTANPSVRFAGLTIIDSGSIGGSGSFLYDSVQDEFIFVHRGNGTNVTSSHFVLGPETYDSLGNETYLTTNRLPKGTGKEHLVDSQISDDGTTVSISGALTVTGNITGPIRATNGVVSGSSQITGITNAQLNNSTISGKALGTNLDTLTIGSGLSGTSYNGSAAVTIANTGVTSNVAGTGITVSGATGAVTITNSDRGSSQFIFKNFAVAGQTTVAADGNDDTLTLAAGSNVTITTNASTDTITIASTDTNTVTTNLAGTGVSVSSGTGNSTISIGQSVATSASPTFAGLSINGAITATGNISAYVSSDRRLKNNIVPIENALTKLNKIGGYSFDWTDDYIEKESNGKGEDGYFFRKHDIGVIAQELQEILPEAVAEKTDGYLGVRYEKIIPLLIQSIKELQIEIKELKSNK